MIAYATAWTIASDSDGYALGVSLEDAGVSIYDHRGEIMITLEQLACLREVLDRVAASLADKESLV